MESFGSDREAWASSRSSFRIDEDEQELQAAALERLPTFSRLRATEVVVPVADNEDGGPRPEHKEKTDAQKLGARERQEFIRRVLRVAAEDNECLLHKLRDRCLK